MQRLRRAIQQREYARAEFVRVSGDEQYARRFEELEAEASRVFFERERLIADEARWDAVEAANAEHLRVGEQLGELAERAHQYRYAKSRVDRLEESTEKLERAVKAYRDRLRKEGVVPPALPEDVAYVDPDDPYEQQVLPGLVRDLDLDMRESATEVAEGLAGDESGSLSSFSSSTSEQAKEVAEELFRIMRERGYQLTRRELLHQRDDNGVQ